MYIILIPQQTEKIIKEELALFKVWQPWPELPDFSWYKIPKWEKYTILPQTIPNVHKIYQRLPCKTLQNLPIFGFFGLKTNHLATLAKSIQVSQVTSTLFTFITDS
jgi:hypothetical protein